MKTPGGRFAAGFAIGLLVFVLLNLLAAHFRSDCGLTAVLGMARCSDDIRRAGFPLLVWEEGGFAYRSSFNPGALLIDLLIGLGVGVASGLLAVRLAESQKRKMAQNKLSEFFRDSPLVDADLDLTHDKSLPRDGIDL